MQTPVKPGAQKRTRTHRHRVITDTWTGDKKGHEPGELTHRLRNLGIASPFDLPKDPYFLLELFAIVLCRRIHFLSVKTLHYFRVITEPLKFNLQGNQDNRTVRADNEFGARDSQNRNRNSTTPLSLHWRGGPGRVHLPSSGHFKEQPTRPKRFNQQDRWTGQQPTLNSLRKLRSIFLTFKNHLWQRN